MKAINEKKLYDLLYRNFVSKEWESISGILHKNNYLYASNQHVLVKVKYNYKAEKEDASIDKNGKIIDKPAKYEDLITDPSLYGEIIDIDTVEKLKIGAKKLRRIRRKDFEPIIDTGLTPIFDDYCNKIIAYRAVYLKAAFDLFNTIKEDFNILFRTGDKIYDKRLIFRSLKSDTVVEIMPVNISTYEVENMDSIFTIDEAVKFEKGEGK